MVTKQMQRTLDKYYLTFVKVNPDGSIDIEGNLSISSKTRKFTKLPDDLIKLNINELKGHYDCSNNSLTSFVGSPKIINGNFSCYNTILTNDLIEGFPSEITGDIVTGGGHVGNHEDNLKVIKKYQRPATIKSILS